MCLPAARQFEVGMINPLHVKKRSNVHQICTSRKKSKKIHQKYDRSVIYLVRVGSMTKGEETRQFIIERSAPIFNTKGIAATAMSDIMEATKLSKGSLYVHFENKDVLADAVVDYNMDQLARKIDAAIARHTEAKAKLLAYVDTVKDAVNHPMKGGCPILNFGMEADDTNHRLRKKINDRIQGVLKRLTSIIKDGIKNGEFKSTWNYRDFATIMFAMIEGGVMISRVAGNNSAMEAIARQLEKMIAEQIP